MSKNSLALRFFIFGVLLVSLGVVAIPLLDQSKESEFSSELLRPISAEGLLAEIDKSSASIKLLNVWATWCGPCIEEFPSLLKLREQYQSRGLELILVSADMPEDVDKIESFLRDQKVNFFTYLKTDSDEDFIKAMNPDWSGALPASFIYNRSGQLVDFWTGDLTYEEFESKINPFLK